MGGAAFPATAILAVMAQIRWKPAVDQVRKGMVHMATRHVVARRLMQRSGRELTEAAQRAQAQARDAGVVDTYGGSYFGEGRDSSGDRAGRSGYARYDRIASNADIAGWLLWRNFRVTTALDVGCATGYLVEVLRELGIDAQGCDLSQYAVDQATEGAAGHLRVANLFAGLPWPDGSFDLVTALEILEHLPPDRVPIALAELRRVCGAYLYATIPSFGRNRSGADGHFEGKVRPERLDHYNQVGADYLGPIPEPDLAVDADGQLVEGHMTIASFEWWTQAFADVGFTRCPEVERRLYADIEPAGLEPFWNIYVFKVDGAPADMIEPRRPEQRLDQLGLDHPLFEIGMAGG
jgi:SAM-dependent methyltransferase